MFFILEGPDGAGKTTLAEKLMETINCDMFHFGKPETKEEAFNYYQVYAEAIMDADSKKNYILDRSWYSDMVYGPIMRNMNEMSELHANMLEACVLANGGGLVLYLTAKLDVLWRRCKTRGETHILDKEILGMISKRYEKVMSENCKLPLVRYDTGLKW